MMWNHYGMAMLPLGLLFLLIIAASAAALVIFTMRHTGTTPPAPPTATRHAEELLADRYARGDIDEAEYHLRLEVLHRTR
jgi:putative membrane protein